MTSPQDVLAFWLDEVKPEDWYRASDALDAEITKRFSEALQIAADGGHSLWLTCPSETLAYIILTDQFSRNIHRNKAAAFDTDDAALAAAKVAVSHDWDLRIDAPARQFFYMPFMHSEHLSDQDRSVRLFCARMPDGGAGNIEHARAHREIIRVFGRFPYRNAALGRANSPEEQDFLDNGGYGRILNSLDQPA